MITVLDQTLYGKVKSMLLKLEVGKISCSFEWNISYQFVQNKYLINHLDFFPNKSFFLFIQSEKATSVARQTSTLLHVAERKIDFYL